MALGQRRRLRQPTFQLSIARAARVTAVLQTLAAGALPTLASRALLSVAAGALLCGPVMRRAQYASSSGGIPRRSAARSAGCLVHVPIRHTLRP